MLGLHLPVMPILDSFAGTHVLKPVSCTPAGGTAGTAGWAAGLMAVVRRSPAMHAEHGVYRSCVLYTDFA